MEQIDWDKAPEGSEYWCDGQWFKVIDGEWFAWYPLAISWAKPAYKSPENFSWWGRAVERPSPSPAWSGEGLPPVGVRCEAAIPHTSGPDNERSYIWIEGSVIAYYEIKGKTYAWFAEDDGFYPPNVLEFRPIRTPEQIVADEREDAIRAIVYDLQDAENLSSLPSIANCLYDKGYRKP